MAERPHFVATAAGADEALGRIRRRRRRSGAVAGGSGVVLSAVAAAFVVLAPADKDALRIDDTPVTDPAPTATGQPRPPTPTPAPTASPRPSVTATSATGRPPAPAPVPGRPAPVTSPTAPGAPPPAPTPSPTAASEPGRTTMSREAVAYSASTDCDVTGEPGWCVRWTGQLRSRVGQPAVLGLQLCNLPDGRGGQAQFADAREIDVRMYQGQNAPAWGWYDDRPGRRGATVDVADGTCLQWRLAWDGRRLDGRPMEAGDYTLSYGVDADLGPFNSFTTYVTTYTISD